MKRGNGVKYRGRKVYFMGPWAAAFKKKFKETLNNNKIGGNVLINWEITNSKQRGNY